MNRPITRKAMIDGLIDYLPETDECRRMLKLLRDVGTMQVSGEPDDLRYRAEEIRTLAAEFANELEQAAYWLEEPQGRDW